MVEEIEIVKERHHDAQKANLARKDRWELTDIEA